MDAHIYLLKRWVLDYLAENRCVPWDVELDGLIPLSLDPSRQ